MLAKVLIKRRFKKGKAKEVLALLNEFRAGAMNRKGYVSGHTLVGADDPQTLLVISTWQSSDDWKKWLQSEERNKVQSKIDALLGGETKYDIFHYGFSE